MAPDIVQGIMCYPQAEERVERERMLSTARRRTGEGKVRRAVLSEEAFRTAVSRHPARGGIAGCLFMTYLQLRARYKITESPFPLQRHGRARPGLPRSRRFRRLPRGYPVQGWA